MGTNGSRECGFKANASNAFSFDGLRLFDFPIAVTGIGSLGVNQRPLPGNTDVLALTGQLETREHTNLTE
jgi:hypothetical protein